MTQRVVRTVAGDALTEAAQTHVEPYKLVKITFPINGDRYYSEGQSTEFPAASGNIYQAAAIRVVAFSWLKDGQQIGSISLFNAESNDAVAVVLSNRIAGNPIEIYQTYRTTGTNNTTPVLLVKGECSGSDIDPDSGVIKIKVVTQNANTQYIPNRYFTPAEGFNHVPAAGRSITFGNEIFVFERAK